MREILVPLPVELTRGKNVYFSMMLSWLRDRIFLIHTVQTEGEPYA